MDPEPQEGAATVGYVAAPEPLLVPSKACGDSVDGITLKFLLKGTLAKKKWKKRRQRRGRSGGSSARWSKRRRGGELSKPCTTSSPPGLSLLSSSRRRKKKRKKRLLRAAPRSVSGCCLRSAWTRPRLLRTAWLYSGYLFMPRSWRPFWTNSTQRLREGGARAVRTWKPGLSTSFWYLAPICLVLVTPEEHRKIWGFSGRRPRVIISTAPCIWQSLVRCPSCCSPEEYRNLEFSGR